MARRLPAGVRELDDGTFRIRRQVGGIRQDRRANTYEQAMAIYRELYGDNVRAVRVDRSMTVGRYVRRYIAEREDLAATSRRSFESLVRNYLEGTALEGRRLVEVTEDDVAVFIRALGKLTGSRTGRPLSGQTIAQVRKLLSAALNRAERAGQISRNPVRLVKGPRIVRQRIQPPTVAEMSLIHDNVQDHPLRALYLLATHTGLREGEVLGLRWSDVRLEGPRPVVAVTGTLDPATGIRHDIPKTDAAYRDVGIRSSTVMALKVRKQVQDDHRRAAGRAWRGHEDLIFTTRTGHPVDARNLLRQLERVGGASGATASREARGIARKLRWHDFRHAFATTLLEEGLPLVTVSQLLGHRSIKTTADLYGHLTSEMRDEAAEVAERALG